MSYQPRWRKGDWLAICDRCGLKFPASQLRRTWDNLYVCSEDWEERHPMDFLQGRPDDQSVAWTRPESTDTFLVSYTPSYANIPGTGFNRSRSLNASGTAYVDLGTLDKEAFSVTNVSIG